MWKTGLLAAAVGVATLAATIVIGRPLVEPEDTEEATVVTTPTRSWGEQASDRCRDALASVRAELAAVGGQANTAERAVRLFDSTTEIEGRLLRRLRGLPSPAGERIEVDEALDLLESQYRRDAATAARLRKRYDFALLNREVLGYEKTATQLRTSFGELGAQGCVAYFDPRSYR
jgi:hypothetical protein